MKCRFTYIPLFALLCFFVIGCKKQRQFDERITLRHTDDIPYGTRVASELLGHVFPDAYVYTDKKSPGEWTGIDTDSPAQAVVLIAKEFNADEFELAKILNFARQGNYVFITAKNFSAEAIDFFGFGYNDFAVDAFGAVLDDSVRNQLEEPAFTTQNVFAFPGKKYESFFYSLDTAHSRVLGRTADGQPNFIGLRTGEGGIFIHISPISFSNYFILHKQNVAYFENIMSVMPRSVKRVLWNEYYLTKPRGKGRKPNLLSMLMRYPAFRWGLLTALGALLLFVLLGMRRRQRPVPVIERPKNDSLDFVQTLGRLYYDKRDHGNLARKMAAYFFDHIRNRYKMGTTVKDAVFVKTLHQKSGYSEEQLKGMLDFIAFLETAPAITEQQLVHFHGQLEAFYQHTK